MSKNRIRRLSDDPSIAPVVRILEDVFQQLNRQYFESALSRPVITVSPDPQRKDRLGWCTTQRVWQDGDSEGYFEINICAEFLNRPVEQICEILLHEMCHLLNAENGTKDTSRGGTYHNEHFKEAAEEHGLVAVKGDKYGYSATSLTQDSKEFIRTLDLSPFDLYRQPVAPINPESSGESANRKPSSARKYICPKCKTMIRATKDVKIRCDECDEPFVKQD